MTRLSSLVSSSTSPYLSPVEAAVFLGYAPATLAGMRSRGEGPPFLKPRGRVRYRRTDLVAWVEGRGGAA